MSCNTFGKICTGFVLHDVVSSSVFLSVINFPVVTSTDNGFISASNHWNCKLKNLQKKLPTHCGILSITCTLMIDDLMWKLTINIPSFCPSESAQYVIAVNSKCHERDDVVRTLSCTEPAGSLQYRLSRPVFAHLELVINNITAMVTFFRLPNHQCKTVRRNERRNVWVEPPSQVREIWKSSGNHTKCSLTSRVIKLAYLNSPASFAVVEHPVNTHHGETRRGVQVR